MPDSELLRWPDQASFDRDVKASLARKGIKTGASTSERNVYQLLNVDDDQHSSVTIDLCGIYHLLEGLLAIDELPRNLMAVPEVDRKKRRLASIPAFGGGSPTVTPKFRFRIPEKAYGTVRTDSAKYYPFIIPALVEYGAPTPIILMTTVSHDAVLRRCQRISASIWDYWRGSRFDDVILFPNKGSHELRTIQGPLQDSTVGAIAFYGEEERRYLDTRGWTLSQWGEYLSDERVPIRVRRHAAMNEPLFPTRPGKFISASGYSDQWYAPAMKKAGLPQGTHYSKHCGVHLFLDWVDEQEDLTELQRNRLRIAFARNLGWAWPEMMLAIYSMPQRRAAALAVARSWHADRPAMEARIASGEFEPKDRGLTKSDPQLSKLVAHAMETLAAHG
ncbi:hypothetical protein [Qipengyuania flava]|uniref:hypothetical protein n=1 Tax=Qipengyuania flava TaxID=192812 RepID=UPI001CD234BE|nr:hypothetical protein [Qipengyuania flava]MCA0891258.1 hypothetical protein [Qipengyuania flava]